MNAPEPCRPARAIPDAASQTQRWPRTERRQARIRSVLARRQPDLTVVLENVHDPHNVSAILRSCDGVGVLRAHAVYSIEEPPPGAFARQTSASAAKWVEVEQHTSLADCLRACERTVSPFWSRASAQMLAPSMTGISKCQSHWCLAMRCEGCPQRREILPTARSRSRWPVWWRA